MRAEAADCDPKSRDGANDPFRLPTAESPMPA